MEAVLANFWFEMSLIGLGFLVFTIIALKTAPQSDSPDKEG